MGALAFWKAVVNDKSNFLERVVALLAEHEIRYCVIGGVGVNAYAEPMVTQDLDIIVAVEQLAYVRRLMEERFKVREFEHSVNVYDPDSGLQVQIRLDAHLQDYVDRAQIRDVMGLRLPVAAPGDLLLAKSAAAMEPTRRRTKRAKDEIDIAHLVDAVPEIWKLVPEPLRDRIAELREPSE